MRVLSNMWKYLNVACGKCGRCGKSEKVWRQQTHRKSEPNHLFDDGESRCLFLFWLMVWLTFPDVADSRMDLP